MNIQRDPVHLQWLRFGRYQPDDWSRLDQEAHDRLPKEVRDAMNYAALPCEARAVEKALEQWSIEEVVKYISLRCDLYRWPQI